MWRDAGLTECSCDGFIRHIIMCRSCNIRSFWRAAAYYNASLWYRHGAEVVLCIESSSPIPPEENTTPFGPTFSRSLRTDSMISSLLSGMYSARTKSTPWLYKHGCQISLWRKEPLLCEDEGSLEQQLGQPWRVGVCHVARQDFVPDDHGCCFHGFGARGGVAPQLWPPGNRACHPLRHERAFRACELY